MNTMSMGIKFIYWQPNSIVQSCTLTRIHIFGYPCRQGDFWLICGKHPITKMLIDRDERRYDLQHFYSRAENNQIPSLFWLKSRPSKPWQVFPICPTICFSRQIRSPPVGELLEICSILQFLSFFLKFISSGYHCKPWDGEDFNN